MGKEHTLTMDAFANNLKSLIQKRFPDYDVSIGEVIKNNDLRLTALHIRKNGANISSTIYLEKSYKAFLNGISIKKICNDLANTITEMTVSPCVPEQFTINVYQYQSLKDNLYIILCNLNTNKERLKSLVWATYGDFALTYAIVVSTNHGDYTMYITKDIMHRWNIDISSLHKDAMLAAANRGFLFGKLSEPLNNSVPCEKFPFYILSNDDLCYGASAILHKNTMTGIIDTIGEVYIIPSSIHEVLMVPKKIVDELGESFFSCMIYTINRTDVEPEIRLADKGFYYDPNAEVKFPVKLSDLLEEGDTIAEYTTTNSIEKYHCIVAKDSDDIYDSLNNTLIKILNLGGTPIDVYHILGAVIPDAEKNIKTDSILMPLISGYAILGQVEHFKQWETVIHRYGCSRIPAEQQLPGLYYFELRVGTSSSDIYIVDRTTTNNGGSISSTRDILEDAISLGIIFDSHEGLPWEDLYQIYSSVEIE